MDELGFDIDVEDDALVVGIEDHDEARGGAAVFTRHDGGWRDPRILAPAARQLGDSFGVKVALEAGWLAVGAPGSVRSPGNGAVYLFRPERVAFSRRPWVPVGTLRLGATSTASSRPS